MVQMDRAALVAHLARSLDESEGYASSTHMKNCLFFLQERHGVDLGYEFVIHRFGPFSFELNADLAGFRREGILSVSSNGGGVRYKPGPNAPALPAHLASAGEAIEVLAKTYGLMDAQDLDVHATAFFVAKRLPEAKPEEIAGQVRRIKPRVSSEAVERALSDLAVRS